MIPRATQHPTPSRSLTQWLALGLAAAIALALFIMTLLQTKSLFNPADWMLELKQEGRVVPVPNWDAEIYDCGTSAFSLVTCQSVSGSFIFEQMRLPMPQELTARMADMAEGATHLRLRHELSQKDLDWISLRRSEEFLNPQIVFFRNHRCFATGGNKPYCGHRTESFPLNEVMKNNSLEIVFPIGPSASFGTRSFTPVVIESHLLSRVLSLEDRAAAAFTTEGVMLATTMVFFAALALLFPWHAATVIMFLFCLLKVAQTALSYAFESQGYDILFAILGTHGYTVLATALNAAMLLSLLHLTTATLRGSFAVSRLEIGYGLGLTSIYVIVAGFYSKTGEFDVAAFFARDAIATLFGAIWIIYHLLTEWSHGESKTNSPPPPDSASFVRHNLKTFVYLFFLVSYGAAGAQTVLGTKTIPDLLPWQSLFFIPGLGLAVLLDLSIAHGASRQGSPIILGAVKVKTEQ